MSAATNPTEPENGQVYIVPTSRTVSERLFCTNKNLELHSEGFASADAISAASDNADDTEFIHLSENSVVLDLLLQYMYRQRQPDLADIKFPILADLAEAAEKYEVYSAMTICNVHMRYAIQGYPVEVLGYAFKHDYPKLMDEAAPLTIDMPVDKVTACWELMPSRIFTVWVALDLGAKPGTLRNLQIVFGRSEKLLETCKHCLGQLRNWRNSVQGQVDRLPKFSTLL
ncbi:hypothetical protein PILCRDRAFT_83487 [Piloderma croceum F 1598]|uniref:BTB domain-containing protein n=1 Tax=Piloderma croceum (strain F 1598) TaxID=765440 RepID=A0A0C3CRG5_PILCF|nr:hypothetical protein PILCRDRAFT_83487 [Piloderma croceum F 1598]